MAGRSIVLDTSDGTLVRYSREFDRVTFEFKLWDETVQQVVAVGVTRLEDSGTWEVDAVVRVPEWDGDGGQGFGIVNVADEVTLRFAAECLDL